MSCTSTMFVMGRATSLLDSRASWTTESYGSWGQNDVCRNQSLSRFECSVLANSSDNLALASTWIPFLQLSHEISSSFHGHDHIYHCSAPRREESSDYAKSNFMDATFCCTSHYECRGVYYVQFLCNIVDDTRLAHRWYVADTRVILV